MADALAVPILDVGPEPRSRRVWLADVWAHREILVALSRKDFQTRYKRASLGILWAVAVPLIQGTVIAFVFSRVLLRANTGSHFSAYVLSGIMAWSFFATTLQSSTTSVVDGSSLAEKVWFPRVVLPIVPACANAIGLLISYAVLLAIIPLLGVGYHLRLLLLVPGIVLLLAFAIGVGMVLSALYVYFRDVRFLVQASLLVWLYVTPIIYMKELLGANAGLLDANPMTGIVTIFHAAVMGPQPDWQRPVLVTVVATIVLLVVGMEAHRRHERLFVDQL